MMRSWGKNISINGSWILNSPDPKDENLIQNPNPEPFEIDVQNVLRRIEASYVAKLLTAAVDGAPHNVTIRPVSDQAQAKVNSSPVSDGAAGNKVGSDVNIWFTPNITVGNGHFHADDTLFHELFHALRQARGRFNSTPMQPLWDKRDEFYACLLTNIYVSQPSVGRDKDRRGSHGSAKAPFVQLTLTDEEFYSKYRDEILDLWVDMGDIFSSVSLIPDGWNPLRVEEKWRKAFGDGLPDFPP